MSHKIFTLIISLLIFLVVTPKASATNLCSQNGIITTTTKDSQSLYPDVTFVRINNKHEITHLDQIKNITCLEYFDIYNEEVEGDLSSLSQLINLKYLNLHTNPKITGDICNLKNATELKSLKLAFNPEIAGDIACFNNINLETFAMTYTGISGNLTSLSHMTKLKELYLSGTLVEGDISALSSLVELEQLVIQDSAIHGSKITGDLANLKKLTKLKKVSLYNMDVKNCKQFMKDHPAIEEGGCKESIFDKFSNRSEPREKSNNYLSEVIIGKTSGQKEATISSNIGTIVIAVASIVGILIFLIKKRLQKQSTLAPPDR